jgi:hypothetical protein
MRLAAMIGLLALTLPSPVPAASLDYADLTFPGDAKELVVDQDGYHDGLEFLDDKVLASVKRLYAAAFLDNVMNRCAEKGFWSLWSDLKRLPGATGSFLSEMRANKDLDEALAQSRHVRDALKHGAKSIGRSDSEKLLAQGLCKAMKK